MSLEPTCAEAVTAIGWVEDFKPYIFVSIADAASGKSAREAIRCRALLDSGATDVIIRPDDVERFGLVPTGEWVTSQNVGFTGSSPVFRTNVSFPGKRNGEPAWFTSLGARTLAFEFGDHCDVIVGMSALQLLDFSVLRSGRVELLWDGKPD